jgi:hypothetical protein
MKNRRQANPAAGKTKNPGAGSWARTVASNHYFQSAPCTIPRNLLFFSSRRPETEFPDGFTTVFLEVRKHIKRTQTGFHVC